MSLPPTSRLARLAFWPVLAMVIAAMALFAFRVDLAPRVESDFFFASDDPQLRASQQVEELFPSSPQLLISAVGEDLLAPDYLERLGALGESLLEIEGVRSVQSLVRGPARPETVASSPLWSRLLLGENPRLSLLLVAVEEGDERRLIDDVETLIAEHDRPSFSLGVSGVPYVVEQIRRSLGRDLRLFSILSLAVFGLLIALIYRSPWIVAGTLLVCLGACVLALAALHLVGTPIGLLTANIVTIVFVLTLSHVVFLTAAHNRRRHEGGNTVDTAVDATFPASFWCMLTTLLGFASLLLASARPLRELGIAGAVGTAAAILVAYALYPPFLARSSHPRRGRDATTEPPPALLGKSEAWTTVAIAVLVAVAAFGLPRLDTDPNLLSYFAAGTELRAGLEQIDRNGGSSPLLLVLADADREPLDTRDADARLSALQTAFDERPEIGTALSLPVLVDEAERVPLAALFSTARLIRILESDRFDNIARSVLTEDHERTLFFLRMHEAERTRSRLEIVETLRGLVRDEGLEAVLVGGLFELQGQLGALVGRSLISGLGGLLALFVVVAAVVSRSPASGAAMVLGLAAIPVLVLGAFGLAELPVDVISSPAANVAIALGIDSMIHLVSAVRRKRRAGVAAVWAAARGELWRPIAGAALILASGFGIFAFSSFPPTRRFGLAIAAGTLVAAIVALLVVPFLARILTRNAEVKTR